MFIVENEALKYFKTLFLKSKGLLHKDGTSLISILNLNFDKKFQKEVILKYIATEYYLKPEALSQEEKDVFKSSPWFPELRLNLKYPTVFDVESYAKSPNSNWNVYLRENKNSFLVFWEKEYITQLTLGYKVSSFTVWEDYLVLIDEGKVLRAIYLYSLKEVHKKEGKGFKEVKSDKERLYLIYENGITQAFKVNEVGISFEETAKIDTQTQNRIKVGISEVLSFNRLLLSLSEEIIQKIIQEKIQINKTTYNLRKVFWVEPYLIFIDEDSQAYGWQKEGEEFVYKFYLGKIEPSQEFKDLQALNVEGWRVEKDFILFKDGKVAGSKGFQKHVNVLLGSNLVSFEEFKGIILAKPLEVLT